MTEAGTATVGHALNHAARRLAAAGIANARREARLLLAVALKAKPLDLLAAPERPLTQAAGAALAAALARRCDGEPLSRIAGQRGFWNLELSLSPAVLDPRPDTELLVERVLHHLAARGQEALRLLDLGTGSGCILLALLSELPRATGLGIDRSRPALMTARANAQDAGLLKRSFWAAGAWSAPVAGRFDVVVANPPYIPSGALATLNRSVRLYDPAEALDGGPDGLSAYRLIVPALPKMLESGGIACLEVGRGQAGSVAAMGAKAGLLCKIHPDLAGIQRSVSFLRKKEACIAGKRR